MAYGHAATMLRAREILRTTTPTPPSKENRMVRTGAPVLYEPEEILEPQRSAGYSDGIAGKTPHPPLHYTADERSAYFQGHIRGGIERRRHAAASKTSDGVA